MGRYCTKVNNNNKLNHKHVNCNLGFVHTTPEKFESGRFTLKTLQMFAVHSAQSSPLILDLCLRKTQSGKSHDYRDVIVFEKAPF